MSTYRQTEKQQKLENKNVNNKQMHRYFMWQSG